MIATVLLCLIGLTGCGGAAPSASATEGPKPTVVLVHGAFADASSWYGVVTRLQKQGYTVVAPALGMRGLASDSAYLASLLSQIKGPVVLVGHSYGGAVISNAATWTSRGGGAMVGWAGEPVGADDRQPCACAILAQSLAFGYAQQLATRHLDDRAAGFRDAQHAVTFPDARRSCCL